MIQKNSSYYDFKKNYKCPKCKDTGFILAQEDAINIYGEGFPPVDVAYRCKECPNEWAGLNREKVPF